MTIKNWFQLFALLALTTVYAVYFTDWFKPKIIHIVSTSRGNQYTRRARRNAGNPPAIPPNFMLDTDRKLTDVKVVLLSAWQTNHDVVPMWHVTCRSKAEPVLRFTYGHEEELPELEPAVPGTHAQPLEPDETYRIFLKAGAYKGQQDFVARSAE
jgi:hypothetical protein